MSDQEDNIEHDLTDEELEFKKIFDAKLKSVDKSFSNLGLNPEQMKAMLELKSGEKNVQLMKKYDRVKAKMFDLPTIDSKGREIFSNEELHERYFKSFAIWRHTQLPVCYHNYKSKLLFTAPLTFMGAYAYQVKNLLQSCKGVRDMHTKQLALSWAFLYGISFVVCTLDSLYWDDYCDINSYHYNLKQNRKSMMRDIKSIPIIVKYNRKTQTRR